MEEAPAPPTVSVVIVSWNCASSLRRCLAALSVPDLVASTPPSTPSKASVKSAAKKAEPQPPPETLEVLVVDNGSDDEGPRLDSEFPSVTFLRLPRNFGLTKARNIAIRSAQAESILLLSPFAEMTPQAVFTLARRLDNDPYAAAACPLLVDPDSRPHSAFRRLPTERTLARSWRSGSVEHGELPDGLDQEALEVEYPPDAAILVRKQFLKGMNYFDERYGEFLGDAELCWQIRHAERKIVLMPGVRVAFDAEAASSRLQARPARALLAADFGSGASVYVRRRHGVFAGLRFRIAAALSALGLLLILREPGFQIARLKHLVVGQKIDGTQHGL